MAIDSHPFGSTRLTGADARRFLEQIENEPPSAAAREAYRRGAALVKELDRHGHCKIVLPGQPHD